MNKDNKDVIISVVAFVAVAALIVGGYLYVKNKKQVQQSATESATQSAIDATDAAAQSATQGVLPSVGEAANPLENKPVINPVDVSNPFKDVQTNPFQ